MVKAQEQSSQSYETNTGWSADSGSKELQPRRRKRNSYYYYWLDSIYKFVVRPNSRVLLVGCECGDLLAAVRPSYNVIRTTSYLMMPQVSALPKLKLLPYIHEHHFSTQKDVLNAADSILNKVRIFQMTGIPSLFGIVYEIGHFAKDAPEE